MKAIVANLGFILQASGIITLLAVPVAFVYNEQVPLIAFFITSAIFMGSGFLMNAFSQRKELDFRSSCTLTSSVFFLLGIVGSIPFFYTNIFADSDILSRAVNSIFESVSGYTTTGLTLLTDLDSLPRSIILYRSLTQWIGGIGIVFIVLVFFGSGETLDSFGEAIGLGRITSTMKRSLISVLLIYSAYTLIFAAILYAVGLRDWVNNISLVFSTISTGGFSPVNDFSTLVRFPVNAILAVLMILGATSFAVHYELFRGRFKKATNAEFVILVAMVVFVTIIFSLLAGVDMATGFFHVAAASTTTGSSFVDLASLAVSAKMLLFILMFIGGSASSTAGGVKIITIMVFLKSIPWVIRGVITGEPGSFVLGGKELKHLDILSYLLTIILAMAVITASAFVFTLFGFSLTDSLFESTSAFSNTGLSVGITSISLPIGLKILLALVMIVGRIGLIALLVVLAPKVYGTRGSA